MSTGDQQPSRVKSGGNAVVKLRRRSPPTSLGFVQRVAGLSTTTMPSDGPLAGADRAREQARDHLLRRQDTAGWWKAELETNVTMDAEDLLLREFLGVREPETSERAAVWIRSQQRADGT